MVIPRQHKIHCQAQEFSVGAIGYYIIVLANFYIH